MMMMIERGKSLPLGIEIGGSKKGFE